MGAEWHKVLVQVAGMSLIILAGWLIRRRGYLDRGLTAELSLLVADVAMPALIFLQMMRTVTWASLSGSWYIPLAGLAMTAFGFAVSYAAAWLFAVRRGRATAVFLAGMPNSVYLPLPIAMALYGADGTMVVLLFYVGFIIATWTLGIWVLGGGRIGWAEIRRILFNPGFIATVIGILWALFVPGLARGDGAAGWGAQVLGTAGDTAVIALEFAGSLTVPLSLLVIGAQMAEPRPHGAGARGTLALTLVLRLLIGPAIVLGVLALAPLCGWRPPHIFVMIALLIAAMPIAATCGVIAERYGGKVSLAARAIFISTLLSVVTVPAFFLLGEKIFSTP